MSTLTVTNVKATNIQDSAGANSSTPANLKSGGAKAWIDFTGTGTVATNSSFNVSGLTDLGTGQYLVTFTTAFATNEYVVSVCASDQVRDITTAQSSSSWVNQTEGYSPSTTSVFINLSNGAAYSDRSYASVICCGDQ